MVSSVVLIHGAWHGGWAWDRVVPILEAEGIECLALDLPGHGDDDNPFGDLATDVQQVQHALARFDPDSVVLVGHSYGGSVITEAGLHPAVRHLVYIAAFALDSGESCAQAAMSDEDAARISHEGRPDLGSGFVIDSDGLITLDPATAARCFYNTCEPDAVAFALDRLCPQPLSTLQGIPKRIAWRSKPSTYAVCTEDLGVHPDLQRIMARRCRTSVEWPTDHSPFLSDPHRVARLLLEVAREAG